MKKRIMKKEFTKNDLKQGMYVQFRNGDLAVLAFVMGESAFVNPKNGRFESHLGNYNNELKNILGSVTYHWDIMKVYSDYTMTELLWERKEIKLTEAEKTILGNLRCNFNYIARDKEDGRLYVYDGKPSKRDDMWLGNNAQGLYTIFPNTFLSFIKWEDKEPYLISDLLKGVII